jgi:quercetin dioxygenase-like cupin family protein
VLRPRGQDGRAPWRHEGELLFFFVLRGGTTLRREGRADESLVEGDPRAVPARVDHAWTEWSDDVELLEVTLPRPRP